MTDQMQGSPDALSVEQTFTVELPDQGREPLTLGEAGDRIERLAREVARADVNSSLAAKVAIYKGRRELSR